MRCGAARISAFVLFAVLIGCNETSVEPETAPLVRPQADPFGWTLGEPPEQFTQEQINALPIYNSQEFQKPASGDFNGRESKLRRFYDWLPQYRYYSPRRKPRQHQSVIRQGNSNHEA